MIYFIESQSLVKIGFSLKPHLRVSKIQSDSPFPCKLIGLMEGDRAEELRVQALFAHLRVRAEWFRMEPELKAFISENPFIKPVKAKPKPTDAIGKYLWENDMSDRALGALIGISAAQINRVRNGAADPSWRLVKSLYEKTGITPNALMGIAPEADFVGPSKRSEEREGSAA